MQPENNPTNSIISEQNTVSCDTFLEVLKNYDSVRVAVGGGVAPFEYTYFSVDKKEMQEMVEFTRAAVTYSVMLNSKVRPQFKDVLYIHKFKQTIV